MATSGPNSPGTCAKDTAVGVYEWVNYDNVKASDNNYCLLANGIQGVTYYNKCTNFGFTIPSGATIDGILVEIERCRTGAATTYTKDNSVKIVKGGTVSGSEYASTDAYPTTDAYKSYGGTTDKWGVTWADTDINNAGFGVAVSSLRVKTGSGKSSKYSLPRIDHIRITIYYTEGSTPQEYIAQLSAGSFSQSGQDIQAKRGYEVPVGTGAFSQTGQAINAYRGLHADIGLGEFAQSGQSLTVKRGYHIDTGLGEYSLTGIDLPVKRGYLSGMGAGAFELTGQNLDAFRGWHIDIGTGGYSLTGLDIQAKRGYLITFENGAYILTGSDLNVIASIMMAYTASLSAGTFNLAGSDLNAKRGYLSSIQAGGYTLTGNNLTVKRGYKSGLNAGTFTITGQDITISYGRTITLAPGTYVPTGATIDAKYGRFLTLGTGQFTLNGKPLTVRLMYTPFEYYRGNSLITTLTASPSLITALRELNSDIDIDLAGNSKITEAKDDNSLITITVTNTKDIF